MQNNERQAGTEVQQSDTVDVTTSSPNCTKPDVVCSLSLLDTARNEFKNFPFDTLKNIQIKAMSLCGLMKKIDEKENDYHFSQRAKAFGLLSDAIQTCCHIIETEDGSPVVRKITGYEYFNL